MSPEHKKLPEHTSATTSGPDLRAWLSRLALAVLSLIAAPILALPGDSDQPIHIEADRAERDGIQGVTRYEGSVDLVQGSLHILADSITVHTDSDNEVQEIVAVGNPARFEQQPKVDQEIVKGRAQMMRYLVAEERMRMSNDARLEQDGTIVSGNQINYDLIDDLVQVESDQKTEQSRVKIVIPPRAQEKMEE